MNDTAENDTQASQTEQEASLSKLYDRLGDVHRQVRSTRSLMDRLAARRRDAVVALITAGQTHAQIAESMGVSKSAIQQIVQKG